MNRSVSLFRRPENCENFLVFVLNAQSIFAKGLGEFEPASCQTVGRAFAGLAWLELTGPSLHFSLTTRLKPCVCFLSFDKSC